MLYLSFKFVRKFKFCVSPLVKRYLIIVYRWYQLTSSSHSHLSRVQEATNNARQYVGALIHSVIIRLLIIFCVCLFLKFIDICCLFTNALLNCVHFTLASLEMCQLLKTYMDVVVVVVLLLTTTMWTM